MNEKQMALFRRRYPDPRSDHKVIDLSNGEPLKLSELKEVLEFFALSLYEPEENVFVIANGPVTDDTMADIIGKKNENSK